MECWGGWLGGDKGFIEVIVWVNDFQTERKAMKALAKAGEVDKGQ